MTTVIVVDKGIVKSVYSNLSGEVVLVDHDSMREKGLTDEQRLNVERQHTDGLIAIF